MITHESYYYYHRQSPMNLFIFASRSGGAIEFRISILIICANLYQSGQSYLFMDHFFLISFHYFVMTLGTPFGTLDGIRRPDSETNFQTINARKVLLMESNDNSLLRLNHFLLWRSTQSLEETKSKLIYVMLSRTQIEQLQMPLKFIITAKLHLTPLHFTYTYL